MSATVTIFCRAETPAQHRARQDKVFVAPHPAVPNGVTRIDGFDTDSAYYERWTYRDGAVLWFRAVVGKE